MNDTDPRAGAALLAAPDEAGDAFAVFCRRHVEQRLRRCQRDRWILLSAVNAPDHEVNVRLLEGSADAAAFRSLNEEWIQLHFKLEERDRRQLADPVAAYVDPGGAVLIAEAEGEVIGCVALAARASGAYELSKMAVSPAARGRGVGRKLLAAAIDHARSLGATSVYLGSSKRLPSAVHLYEAFGFEHVPRETLDLASTRIDVFMALDVAFG